MAKLKSILSVKQGDAFAVRLKNGLYVVCRVIWDATSDANKRHKKKYQGPDAVRMVCCNWFGMKPPKPDLSELRDVLTLTHHSWNKKPLAGWCSDNVPSDVIGIGTIPPAHTENRLGANDWLDWNYLRLQAFEQWEWDHNRQALLASEKAAETRLERKFRKYEAARRQELTLDKLGKHRFLTEWGGPIPTAVIRKSRKLLRDTAKQ